MTRREFLAYAAAATMPLDLRLPSPPPAPTNCRCLVLPVPGECSLVESLNGYRSALAAQGWAGRETWIVPAVLDIPSRIAGMMVEALKRGTTVIVESGAGFAGHLHFRRHRRALRELLHVDVQAPVDLWSDHPRTRGIPYVEYSWPYRTKVRDFSRVVPVADRGDVIAWVDGLPVGLRRRCGQGTLIYLGSPLGPALWAGDAEAKRWLLSHGFQ